jgi:hypothetical protein
MYLSAYHHQKCTLISVVSELTLKNQMTFCILERSLDLLMHRFAYVDSLERDYFKTLH